MDDTTFTQLKAKLGGLLQLDLDAYKQPQLRRRVESFVTKHTGQDVSAFIARLGSDADLLQATRDMLTINVTEFFRDTAQWDRLEQHLLPEIASSRSSINVWSAGCSHGQEPLSLAMLLDEAGALRRARILATDFDHAALARAKSGGPYRPEEVKGLAPKRLDTYFTKDASGYTADRRLLQPMRFRIVNLLADRFDREFDLIVCRNVMIYFEADVKAALIQRFRDSLRPGGVLFIGATEALLGSDADGFERLGGNFYRRPAAENRLAA